VLRTPTKLITRTFYSLSAHRRRAHWASGACIWRQLQAGSGPSVLQRKQQLTTQSCRWNLPSKRALEHAPRQASGVKSALWEPRFHRCASY